MDMTVMRGTTIPIVLTLTKFGDSEALRLEGDAVIVFRIKSNPNQPGWMYQKILTSAHEQSPGVYAFNMLPSDTETWDYGEYYYDYGIQFSVNDYWPCIATSKFIVVESIAGRVNAADIQYAEIENGSVTTIKLHDGAVTIEKLHESVTPEALGAADRLHNHDDLYYGVQEMDVIIGGINTRIEANADAIEEFKGDGQIKTNNLEDSAVSSEKIADSAVTAAKLKDGAVSRAKLAQDALYSPVQDGVNSRTLTVTDIGKTMKGGWNAAMTLTLTQSNSAQMPVGAEIAVFNYSQEAGHGTKIIGDGVRFFISGDNVVHTSATIKVAAPFGMIALKKFSNNKSLGDCWLVTGDVEVV